MENTESVAFNDINKAVAISLIAMNKKVFLPEKLVIDLLSGGFLCTDPSDSSVWQDIKQEIEKIKNESNDKNRDIKDVLKDKKEDLLYDMAGKYFPLDKLSQTADWDDVTSYHNESVRKLYEGRAFMLLSLLELEMAYPNVVHEVMQFYRDAEFSNKADHAAQKKDKGEEDEDKYTRDDTILLLKSDIEDLCEKLKAVGYPEEDRVELMDRIKETELIKPREKAELIQSGDIKTGFNVLSVDRQVVSRYYNDITRNRFEVAERLLSYAWLRHQSEHPIVQQQRAQEEINIMNEQIQKNIRKADHAKNPYQAKAMKEEFFSSTSIEDLLRSEKLPEAALTRSDRDFTKAAKACVDRMTKINVLVALTSTARATITAKPLVPYEAAASKPQAVPAPRLASA